MGNILQRAHGLQERLNALLMSQQRILNVRTNEPKAAKPKKKQRAAKTIQLSDDMQIAELTEFPEFYQQARDLADEQYSAIREHKLPGLIRDLQTKTLNHWANATTAQLQEAGETEHKRDLFFALSVYVERAHTIHRVCLAVKESATRNPYIVPAIGTDDGFFDHGIGCACNEQHFRKKGENLTKRYVQKRNGAV